MSLSDHEKEALIALSLVRGLGPGRIRSLIDACGSARAVFAADPGRLRAIRGIGSKICGEIRQLDRAAQVRRQLNLARNVGARALAPGQAGYPPLLKETYDPPPVLWHRGAEDLTYDFPIAIVGTRRPTVAGRRNAYNLARSLGERGWTIVSGLAYGIDAAAHRGALDAGGATVAILGCGADVVYPVANRRLFDRIVERGAILSEFPMGEKPEATNFPRRNRLISGMSKGVVVVEAFEKGGGLITARFALDQNRDVFAFPGPAESVASAGSNRLIQAGEAKLILNADDVEIEFDTRNLTTGRSVVHGQDNRAQDDDPIVGILSADPQHIDAICVATGLHPAEVQIRLLRLEMNGAVSRLPGKRFYLRR
ncbi:MAG: DNA-protecting protein DprA [Rhodothermales bacterium]|nr:DNA-protecting protein DprA [Rhodothermales bacterium]